MLRGPCGLLFITARQLPSTFSEGTTALLTVGQVRRRPASAYNQQPPGPAGYYHIRAARSSTIACILAYAPLRCKIERHAPMNSNSSALKGTMSSIVRMFCAKTHSNALNTWI